MAAYDIVTAAQAKSYLNISDTSLDTVLADWISWISSGVEEYTGRKVAAQSISSEIHSGDGTSLLFTDYFPIIQLSVATTPSSSDILAAVQYRTDPASSWQNLMTNSSYILTDTSKPYIELWGDVFPVGISNIKIIYKAGWATIPGDIVKVVLEMVQMMYNESKKGNDWLGRSSISASDTAGQNRNMNLIDMNTRWARVLDRYRKVQI